MSREWGTHAVRINGAEVVKSYRTWEAGQPLREWRALRLLHAHAPGLAPAPLRAALTGDPPSVTMSRLPGEPLRGTALSARRIEALATAVRDLHRALPPRVAAALPARRGGARHAMDMVRRWNGNRSPAAADPPVARALDAGTAWLAAEPPAAGDDLPPVLGNGDGNLANYLWDGVRVRVLDFEDSGRSDRAFELAEITEHVSTWVDTRFDTDAFLAHFALTGPEQARLPACRRLVALVWLFLLSYEDPLRPRNPPGTLRRQAERLMRLLERGRT